MTIDKDTIPTFEYIVERLNDYPKLAYVHLVEPMVPVDTVPYAEKEIAKHFRPRYKGKLIINCGFRLVSAIRVLEDGALPMPWPSVKPFISNPDLVERIRNGLEWSRWDDKTFYTPGHKGYTDYPSATG